MLWSAVLAACFASTALAQSALRLNSQGKIACAFDNCRALKDCPSALTILENARRDKSLLSHLRSLTCGFDKDHPKVCCTPNNIEEKSVEDTILSSDLDYELDDYVEFEPTPITGRATSVLGEKECESGNCQLLKDCPPVLALLENAIRNKTLSSYIQSLSCGFGKDHPKVCCAANDIEERSGEDTVLPSVPNCGLSDNIDFERIVGGAPSVLGQWPWMAALGYRSGPTKISWRCGGTLITASHVLTAAHCLMDKFYNLEKVRLGDLDLDDAIDDGATPVEIFVKKIIPHEEYSHIFNDIGIIKLERPVTFTPLIQPICLPTTPELRAQRFDRKNPFAVGWGSTEFRGPTSSFLQNVQFPVVNNTFCAEIFIKLNQTVTSNHLCAGNLDGEKDTCTGDSGGPLVLPINGLHFYHIGIVSFGYKCAEVGFPGVYTRTTEYIDWISEKIKI